MFAIVGCLPAAPAMAQDPTITDASPEYTVTIPGPSAAPTPTPAPAPSSGSVATAAPAPAPVAALPRQLASTGADPVLVILGGLGVIGLSLLARRFIRIRTGDA